LFRFHAFDILTVFLFRVLLLFVHYRSLLMVNKLWFAARMIKPAMRTDELAFPAFKLRSTVHAILPVMLFCGFGCRFNILV
jgi:hypothetical protein